MLAVTACLAVPAVAAAAPGDLDATYGSGGTVSLLVAAPGYESGPGNKELGYYQYSTVYTVAVDRRGRARLALPCGTRRCRGVVRVRVGGTTVASRRFARRGSVTVRLSRSALRRLERGGTLVARVVFRLGSRRVARQVVLSQRAT